jgi:hypothetical protein
VYSGPDRLDVFCRGADLHTWSKAWTSAGGWSGWYSIGGLSTSDPDAASPGPGTSPQVFVRGVDNAVWQQYWNGSGWIGQTLGGACQSGPSAVYSGPNRLDVFCRGTDARLWAKVWTSATGWSGWNLVGGLSTSDPDAASRGKTSTPQTVVRGSDDNVWQAYWTGSAWAWQSWGSPG